MSSDQVISFKRNEDYIRLPGWSHGKLSFSFRTSSSSGVIMYQPSHHSNHMEIYIKVPGYFNIIFCGESNVTLQVLSGENSPIIV